MKIAKGYKLPELYSAAFLKSAGDALILEDVKTDPIQSGDVWVQMKAAPINPSDLSMVAGTYPHQKSYPFVPGLEGSGIVVASGGGFLANRLIGKRVACSASETGNGTWAEYMKVDAKRCIPLHKDVDFDQGASSLVNPLTALVLLDTAGSRGQAFVNSAAAGALGLMMINLAKAQGLVSINLVRSKEQLSKLKKQGAEIVLNTSHENFDTEYGNICKQYAPATILDAVGGIYSDRILAPAPEGCQLIAYASLSGENISVSPQPIIRQKKSVIGFHLGDWMKSQSILKKLKLTSKAQNLMANGTFQTKTHKHVSLNELNNAIVGYQKQMSAGKWLLTF